jgi:hypothetical protein
MSKVFLKDDHNIERSERQKSERQKSKMTFDVLILPMASKKIRTSKIKNQLPMAYYLCLPRPVGGEVRVN